MPRTKKKVKSIVKTKVISARVTEVVHELLHQQAEDAGMTLSEFAAQMNDCHRQKMNCTKSMNRFIMRGSTFLQKRFSSNLRKQFSRRNSVQSIPRNWMPMQNP